MVSGHFYLLDVKHCVLNWWLINNVCFFIKVIYNQFKLSTFDHLIRYFNSLRAMVGHQLKSASRRVSNLPHTLTLSPLFSLHNLHSVDFPFNTWSHNILARSRDFLFSFTSFYGFYSYILFTTVNHLLSTAHPPVYLSNILVMFSELHVALCNKITLCTRSSKWQNNNHLCSHISL